MCASISGCTLLGVCVSKGAVFAQMCAPYNALQSYKLKVKLTPGTQRKGRAGRQVCCLSPKLLHCLKLWQPMRCS